jgi:radical SAM-linked protein
MTQRRRVTFAKDGPLRWIAHLDLMRTWERTIRRAALPLSYTQGFSPHPRIALAAPLPVGVSGARELIDLWLEEEISTSDVAKRLTAAMPPGLSVSAVEQVSEQLPSMQSCIEAARYEIQFDRDVLEIDAVAMAIDELLARETLEWEEQRGEKKRRYDIRATILDLAARASADGATVLSMHLSLLEGRTGRPAQVLVALGVEAEPLEIVRASIELSEAASVVK